MLQLLQQPINSRAAKRRIALFNINHMLPLGGRKTPIKLFKNSKYMRLL